MFTFQNKYSAAKTMLSVPHPYFDLKMDFRSSKSLRYTLRANPLKSSISPLSTTPKITIIPPKILSNPYKIRLQSNSTKNYTQSTKFHLINHQNPISKSLKTPVKSILFNHIKLTNNTTLSKSYFFTIKITSKLISKNNTHIKSTNNKKTTIHHTKHFLPSGIRLNQKNEPNFAQKSLQ